MKLLTVTTLWGLYFTAGTLHTDFVQKKLAAYNVVMLHLYIIVIVNLSWAYVFILYFH